MTPRSITFGIGFAFAVAGLPPLAIALGWLAVVEESLPVPLWTMGCGGAALEFAGLALLIPESLSRPRALLAALSISALATLFDWIAFGQVQGGWRFMLDAVMNSLALRQNAVHNVVVLFAVLLTLLAMFAWSKLLRRAGDSAGTPLAGPARKRKSKESVG
ncbi:MAG TPA: hypothetical protein VF523_09240 [Burkholderiales bacterium]